MYSAIILIFLCVAFLRVKTWHLHNNVEYYVSDESKCFSNAMTKCSAMQAELVMIQTEDVQLFLERLINATYSSGATKYKEHCGRNFCSISKQKCLSQ